jgi:pimeloyl-ACP methyl ester carboxylesterase
VTTEILPFRIDIPQAELDDLRDRLARTRWPDQLPGVGWDYGIPLEYVRELASYWRDEYDWRVHEARLNGFGQFTTAIDGARVHFLHVRSASPDALPLIITHGWPGSVVEFWDIIGPLTDPAAYGSSPEDAFHLVIPSIPGYGFSGPTRDRGWDARRVARAWAELMSLLGYQRYGAQGGDWGSIISRELGLADPEHVAGVHLNMLITRPPDDPGELTEEETRRLQAARSTVPTGVAVFPREIAPPIRRFAEQSDHIVHWTEFGRGGHFAAMEVPDLLTGDVREFFRALR